MADDPPAELINVTGHDGEAGLPCLCKACLPVAGEAAEASGMQFRRTWAVAGQRVLHFWMLAELAGSEREVRQVRDSVASALATRLERKRLRRAR